MISDFPAIIDACVMVQAAVRDTLLRLSERRLFLARWSDDIIAEMVATLQNKIGRTKDETDHLIEELTTYFPDAWVESGYRRLTPAMPNHEKDRHVLAAAVKEKSELIVTYNVRHFPDEQLRSLDVTAMTPDDFLLGMYLLSPEIVIHELHEQGASLKGKRSLSEVLATLDVCRCNKFTALIREKHNL
jgi:predicted nucleic acid-binding protein